MPDFPISRRQFVGLAAATGFLAACGGSDDASSSASSSGSSSASEAAKTRTFTADNGEIEIPVDPKRVVAAIGSFETDMVAVGVMPVLSTTFAGPWVDLDDSVTITENIPPKAEELAAIRPDLIVGWNWITQEASYDEIKKVAPYVGLGETARSAGPGFDGSEATKSWGTLFLSVCDAVGRRDRGEKLVTEFEQRIDDVAERRKGKGELSVARVEFYEAGTFSYRGQNEDTAELMRRIGLTVIGPDDSVNDESLERLPDIDADWLVVPVGNDNIPKALFEEVSASPLYQSIPAVKAGRVHIVDAELWPGFGHLWARALLDDLERLFVEA